MNRRLAQTSDLLEGCIARVLDRLRAEHPEFGRDLAIDASDLPAYANGQRYVSKGGRERERFSDPDASWGHRSAVSTRKGGGFYGYRVHAAFCARTDLPVAWQVETAGSHESNYVAPLLDTAKGRGFAPETTALDMGYDNERVYGECEGPRLPTDHPAPGDGRSQAGRAQAAGMRAWRVAVRRCRRSTRRGEVAVPHRGVLSRLPVGQGGPPSPLGPARVEALEVALPRPRGGRARVRTLEE